MKIRELFYDLCAMAPDHDYTNTCDTCKIGDPDAEITGVAVAMIPTPKVMREASRRGANFLIVHEPMFHRHMDDEIPDRAAAMKRELAQKLGLTVFRYHDHAHAAVPDMICAGELKYMGFDEDAGTLEPVRYAVNRFRLREATTARELACRIEEKLGIRHVRIVGDADAPTKLIGCSFGAVGGIAQEVEACDVVIAGEICEWADADLVRDYAELGIPKAMLILGHVGSERAGMMHICDIIAARYPEILTSYIECGEVYSYTD